MVSMVYRRFPHFFFCVERKKEKEEKEQEMCIVVYMCAMIATIRVIEIANRIIKTEV